MNNTSSLHASLVSLYRATVANRGHWTERIDTSMQQAEATIHATNKLMGTLDSAIGLNSLHLIEQLAEAKQHAAKVSRLHSSMLQTLINEAQELYTKLRAFRDTMVKDEEVN
jgi:hypothetical protein